MAILPFDSPTTTLNSVGGKGANLARLSRAGFPVPSGFIVSTEAYIRFVEANELQVLIQSALTKLTSNDAGALESASAAIRAGFSNGRMPLEMESAIRSAYKDLSERAFSPSGEGTMDSGLPVAVRSSATAEDLPDLSFAGQQDTFLNVISPDELLKTVINCWSSLWTARAIAYRIRNEIGHSEVALAVIVQEMVQSDVSGVLFTANPLTGLLSESVIDATFGLGEALVSGQVEPDHYVVEIPGGVIKTKTLGEKRISTRAKPGGGVEAHQEDAAARQTLSGEQIQELVGLGAQVQDEYGSPQDIEWAFAGDHLYLLQARPITSLFPVPEVSFDPLIIWFSFGSVQGLLGPMTPLGRDAASNVAVGAGRLFRLRLKPEEMRLFAPAGERLWVKISDLIRNPIGERLFGGMLGFIEPSAREIVEPLAADPRLGAGQGKLKLSTMLRLAYFALPMLPRIAGAMLRPKRTRSAFDSKIETKLSTAQIAPADDSFERLTNITAFIRARLADAFPFLLPMFIPLFGSSMAALNLLNKIAGGDRMQVFEVTRGMPNNVTTEMDLALWDTATTIKSDGESENLFRETDAPELANHYLTGTLPIAAQNAIARFMERYGMRGVGEIDLGQPRWREDPTPIMYTLKSYLNITAEQAPDVLFRRGEGAAHAAIEALAEVARRQPGGWLKEKLVRAAARRIRILMGARESPKFFAVRTMGIARSAILEVAPNFVEMGLLDRHDDLFYLGLSELESFSRKESPELADFPTWKSLIAERRLAYARELRRVQVPRVLVSDGRAFYEGLGAQTDTSDLITGSPVSPGVVEGIVHVVLDPRGAQLTPGEILVCPGTDPAWTPLFMAAGGLITEVGGLMTHGSVVAREYGIPAVVGVHQATRRLKDGQWIRVDGTTGVIAVLPDYSEVY